MEKDNEVKGKGNSLDFGARVYDSRLGRFLSIDPDALKYPSLTPYLFAADNPLKYIDFDGKGPEDAVYIFSGAIISSPFQTTSPSVQSIRDGVKSFSGDVRLYASLYVQDESYIINSVVESIKEWHTDHPSGTISLVGYSYGGTIANSVSKELEAAGIEVELLYIIDGADGTDSGPDRSVSSNVKKNITKFQKNSDSSFQNYYNLKGDASRAESEKTKVENTDQSEEKYNGEKLDHFNIDDYNVKDAIENVQKSQSVRSDNENN